MRSIQQGSINLVVCLLLLVAFTGCHTVKKTAAKRPLDEKRPELLIQKMDSASFKAEWLNMKVSAATEINGESNSFSANIRYRRDSLIWISISSVGIEVARVEITKDSLKLLDRLNFKYLRESFSYLNNTFQLAIDFNMLQALLLGNYFAYLDDSKLRSSYVDDDLYILSTLRRRRLKRSMEVKEPNRRVVQDVWIDPRSGRVAKNSIDDNKLDKKLIVQYEDFQPIDAELDTLSPQFPYKLSLKIESKKPALFTYEITKLLLNKEQEFPFSVPEKYEPMK